MGPLQVLGKFDFNGETYKVTPCILFQVFFGMFHNGLLIYLGGAMLFIISYVFFVGLRQQY